MNKFKSFGKYVATVVMLALCIGLFGNTDAYADDLFTRTEATGTYDIVVMPGSETHFSVPLNAAHYIGPVNSVIAVCDNTDIKVSNAKFTNKALYDEHAATYIDADVNYMLEFDVVSEDSLAIGYNRIHFIGRCNSGYDRISGEFVDEFDICTLTAFTGSELSPIEIYIENIEYKESAVVPGNAFTMKLTLRNNGEMRALGTYLSMDFGASGIIPEYKMERLKIGDIPAGGTAKVEVPVSVLKNAQPDLYRVTANITCKDGKGIEQGPFSQNIYMTVNKVSVTPTPTPTPELVKKAKLVLSTEDNYKELTPKTDTSIRLVVENTGNEAASDVRIYVNGLDAAVGLTKNFTSEYISLGTVGAGEKTEAEIPLSVAKNFEVSLLELGIKAEYDYGSDGSGETSMTVYVKAPEAAEPSPSPTPEPTPVVYRNNVTISSVKQDPAAPKAGDILTISFDITNDGNVAITNTRAFGMNLSTNGFEPISSDPYVKVGTIAAGAKKNVTMAFRVGEEIPSGFSTLSIGYDFLNAEGQLMSDSANIYVLNIQGKVEKNISRPKLIVSSFSTDEEVLKAGSTFNFTFALKNTHTSKSARNIKLTFAASGQPDVFRHHCRTDYGCFL